MNSAIPAAQGTVIVPRGVHPHAYRYGIYCASHGMPERNHPADESERYVRSYQQGYRDQQAGLVQRKAPR